MFIKQVSFTVENSNELMQKKMQKDYESLKNWQDCLSVEVWQHKGEKETTFSMITKWKEQDGFKKWLQRPEHKEAHKARNKEHKENPNFEKPKITKIMQDFELLEF